MSYDFSIINRTGKKQPIRNDDGEFACEDLGKADDIRQRITESFPGVDWNNPAWGISDCGDDLIEFNVGKRDHLRTLTVHTHDPEQAVPFLAELCERHHWSLYDHQTNQMVEWTMT